jgi:hypothetical protein
MTHARTAIAPRRSDTVESPSEELLNNPRFPEGNPSCEVVRDKPPITSRGHRFKILPPLRGNVAGQRCDHRSWWSRLWHLPCDKREKPEADYNECTGKDRVRARPVRPLPTVGHGSDSYTRLRAVVPGIGHRVSHRSRVLHERGPAIETH